MESKQISPWTEEEEREGRGERGERGGERGKRERERERECVCERERTFAKWKRDGTEVLHYLWHI